MVFLVVLVGLAVAVVLSASRAAPVDLVVRDGELTLTLHGRDAGYAQRRSLSYPLEAVRGVVVVPLRDVPRTGLRLPGTSLPGLLRAGSYGTGLERDFWLVRRARLVLVVELVPGQDYRRLVLQVPDPTAEAARLRPDLGVWTGQL